MNKTNEIISKTVLIEKRPFFVSIRNHMTGEYEGEILVRPCASEEDLKEARTEYDRLRESNNPHGFVKFLSNKLSDYYIDIYKTNHFLGNVISKKICKRIRYQKN